MHTEESMCNASVVRNLFPEILRILTISTYRLGRFIAATARLFCQRAEQRLTRGDNIDYRILKSDDCMS